MQPPLLPAAAGAGRRHNQLYFKTYEPNLVFLFITTKVDLKQNLSPEEIEGDGRVK